MSEDNRTVAEEGAETLREYTGEVESALSRPEDNRAREWLLLEGERLVVTAALLGVVFAVLVGLSLVRPADMQDLLTETNTVETLFNTLLSGVILLVSIVVSISSVVLSQEITDIENQEERISSSLEFRRRVEDIIPADVTPARPAEFVRAVLFAILQDVNELQDVAAEGSNEEFQGRLEELGEKIADDVDEARAILGDARLGTFEVLLAGLNYDYSGQLHAARYLKRTYGDDLTEAERDAVDELIDSLAFFTTGREYFKSLYFKRELAQLSSRLLYVSLPVIVFISYVLLAVDARQFPDTWLFGVPPYVMFVSFAYAVALAPYVVLTSYVVRVATVSLRTLAAGPFILQQGNEIESLDFDEYDEELDWETQEAGD